MLKKIIKASSARHFKTNSRRQFSNNKEVLCSTPQRRQTHNISSYLSFQTFYCTKLLSSNKSMFSFCTTRNISAENVEKNSYQKVQLQDWQYVREISESIKNSNTKNAFTLLIQSYLAKKVLDIQIYHSLYLALCAEPQQFPLQYHQVLYKIYRCHFEPHVLLTDWMHRMAEKSRDDKLRLILYKDYQTLGIQVPIFVKSQKKQPENPIRKHRRSRRNIIQPQTESEISKLDNQQQQKEIASIIKQQDSQVKSESFKISEIEFQIPASKDQSQQKSREEKNQQGNKHTPNSQQFQSVLEQILKYNCKVVFHNIQINYEQEELTEDQNFYENDEDQSYFDHDQGRSSQEMNSSDNSSNIDFSALMDFTKITIGRLQIIPRQGNKQKKNSDKDDYKDDFKS